MKLTILYVNIFGAAITLSGSITIQPQGLALKPINFERRGMTSSTPMEILQQMELVEASSHANRWSGEERDGSGNRPILPSSPGHRKTVRSGEATILSSAANLAKLMIGVGVMSLPSGVAYYSADPIAILPALVLCTFMGLLAAYGFYLLGKGCEEHGASTFKQLWQPTIGFSQPAMSSGEETMKKKRIGKDEKYNTSSAWVINAAISAQCFLSVLTSSIVIGDIFSSLARSIGWAYFGDRKNVILLLSGSILLPLCLMESMTALAPFSILGLFGTILAAAVMLTRYLDGTYLPGGMYFQSLQTQLRPLFEEAVPAVSSVGVSTGGSGQLPLLRWLHSLSQLTLTPRIFVLLSMLSTSFVAHYNAPTLFNELKNATTARFGVMVALSYSMAWVMYSLMMTTGFLTFGKVSQGFILNNYSPKDQLAVMARLGVGVAVITGYPLIFFALKRNLFELISLQSRGSVSVSNQLNASSTSTATPATKSSRAMQTLTILVMGIVTLLACHISDASLVVSMSGAVFGSSITCTIPALVTICSHLQQQQQQKQQQTLPTGGQVDDLLKEPSPMNSFSHNDFETYHQCADSRNLNSCLRTLNAVARLSGKNREVASCVLLLVTGVSLAILGVRVSLQRMW